METPSPKLHRNEITNFKNETCQRAGYITCSFDAFHTYIIIVEPAMKQIKSSKKSVNNLSRFYIWC